MKGSQSEHGLRLSQGNTCVWRGQLPLTLLTVTSNGKLEEVEERWTYNKDVPHNMSVSPVLSAVPVTHTAGCSGL